MKRLHALLSILLVALVTGAWVIKDTANPVEIYTGSNTTPTIRAATAGTVQLGLDAATATSEHVVRGVLKVDTRGVEKLFLGNAGSAYSVVSYNAAPTTTTNQYTVAATGPVSMLKFENGGLEFHGFTSQAAASSISTSATSLFGTMTSAGAWTVGPSASGSSVTHTVQSGNNTTLNITSGSGNVAVLSLSPGGSGVGIIKQGTATDLQFRNSADSTVGSFTSAGAWTLGLASGGPSTGLSVKGIGSSTLVVDRTSSVGALSGIELQGGGTKNSRLMASSTNALEVEGSGGATRLTLTQAGVLSITSAMNATAINSSTPSSNPGTFELTDATVGSGDEIHRLQFTNDADATGGFFLRFLDLNGEIGKIEAASATTVAYTTSSDARLKKDIVDYTTGLADVMAMKPRTFKWIENDQEAKGFIAQEMLPVYPDAVTGDPNSDISRPMGMEYGRITPALVSAIKELKAQHDALVADYEAYKAAHP